jgi:hypothetical protein
MVAVMKINVFRDTVSLCCLLEGINTLEKPTASILRIQWNQEMVLWSPISTSSSLNQLSLMGAVTLSYNL